MVLRKEWRKCSRGYCQRIIENFPELNNMRLRKIATTCSAQCINKQWREYTSIKRKTLEHLERIKMVMYQRHELERHQNAWKLEDIKPILTSKFYVEIIFNLELCNIPRRKEVDEGLREGSLWGTMESTDCPRELIVWKETGDVWLTWMIMCVFGGRVGEGLKR